MSKNIDLYTAGTPNGHKIHILVEELGVDYKVHKIDIAKNAQKEEWFLKINRALNARTVLPSLTCSKH